MFSKKTLLFNLLIALLICNNGIWSMHNAEQNTSEMRYTMSSIINGCTKSYSYEAVVTEINFIRYEKGMFVYDIECRSQVIAKLPEKLRLEIPFCIEVKRDRGFQLDLKTKTKPEYIKKIFLPYQTPVQEESSNISNFDKLNEKIANPIYAPAYFLENEISDMREIIPSSVLLVGKCRVNGYCIYKITYDPFKNAIHEKDLPGTFLLFSKQLITKNYWKLNTIKLMPEHSKTSYCINNVSSLNILVPDLKKQLIAQWMLNEYKEQNKCIPQEIIKYIMHFVSEAYLIE